MRVVVIGGGNVGTHMASDLAKGGHEVVLLERERAVATRLRAKEELAGVEVRVADGCELSRLTEAQLERADVVAAVTGDDGPNLVASLLAKQEFGVPRVIARVNHPKNQWLFNETWGVDVSVSTPHLLTALVEEAVSVGTLVRLLQFEGGKAHLEEVTLAPTSPAAGTSLADLVLPRTCSVVAVIRDERVIVPRGDTVLDAGDEVLVLVTAEDDDALHKVFIGD
ncbi:MAG: TrkA family potassium uptake protein [Acidobacteria bacterium]|nr:TrkA family potassium uptake protein [Acidobacteriota bacterium]